LNLIRGVPRKNKKNILFDATPPADLYRRAGFRFAFLLKLMPAFRGRGVRFLQKK